MNPRHQWNDRDFCKRCGLRRSGYSGGRTGAIAYYTMDGSVKRRAGMCVPSISPVFCKKPWYKTEKPAVAPQVESLEKIAPGLKKKAKKVPLTTTTKPSLKAPLIDIMK